ncbi:Trk system potassium uptake protein TrkA [Methanimicrococcus sp. At1]|uniref:Trk system potassium uptake protein TrkA n=1 Tax=Methanimicrococcus hacksteinii TaxID=3028293 RepID=A0ABU3VMC9_9EURY|nr:Trk system potassium transporter TrkA [Methanimicrococcus sp. At1]MDV0444556.1 Trk system potassium uptake protein TrkA [Methanimicrococcus sp. At1]
MKVVVIGAGEVGYNIAKVMSDKNDVIVIDKDTDRAARANELDVQVMVGNGANVDLLKELPAFDLFVAVSSNDEVNILSCLAAKTISQGKVKTIARVSNPDYIKKPVSQKPEVGVDVMVCPELSLASEIAELLYIRGAVDVEVFAEGKVEMIEFIISESNPLIGKSFKDLHLNQVCTVGAILRGSDVIIPNGDSYLVPDDHVIVIIKTDDIEKVEALFSPETETAKKRKKRILLIGCGDVGFYLANLIDKDPHIDLKIIEQNEERCLEVVDLLPHSLILKGDATDIDLLKEEGAGNSDVVVSVTDSDEKNLLCGLMAKHFGAKKIIGRTTHPDYIPVFEMVGIDIALSTRNATINEVLRLTLATSVETLRALPQAQSEILEYLVTDKSGIVGKPVKELRFPADAIISMVVRNGDPIIPNGSLVILPGDRVIVFSKPEAYSKLNKLFK